MKSSYWSSISSSSGEISRNSGSSGSGQNISCISIISSGNIVSVEAAVAECKAKINLSRPWLSGQCALQMNTRAAWERFRAMRAETQRFNKWWIKFSIKLRVYVSKV